MTPICTTGDVRRGIATQQQKTSSTENNTKPCQTHEQINAREQKRDTYKNESVGVANVTRKSVWWDGLAQRRIIVVAKKLVEINESTLNVVACVVRGAKRRRRADTMRDDAVASFSFNKQCTILADTH
jgi:hypothetical protein